jgi:DinB superfamily
MNTTSPTGSELELTTEQTARASRHLSETRDALVDLVTGLSVSQWSFKPADDRWSIAENVEHLALIEGRVHAIIGNLSHCPEADGKQIEADEVVMSDIPKRTTRIKAPEFVCPEGRWTGVEALQCFLAGREQTMRLLAAPLLRGRVLPHPLFGPWDGYQWLLATGSHTQRHTEQIHELKADPMFPPALTPSMP